jgi:hypothetical protein
VAEADRSHAARDPGKPTGDAHNIPYNYGTFQLREFLTHLHAFRNLQARFLFLI